MRKTVVIASLVGFCSVLSIGYFMGRSTAAGGVKSYYAVLNTGQETASSPEPSGAGIGVAQLTLNTDKTLCVNMTVTGLSSSVTAAHVHSGGAGSSGPPIVTLTNGNMGPGVWKGDCGSVLDPLTKAEVELLNKEQLYLNIHTTSHPGGEVRGQIHK